MFTPNESEQFINMRISIIAAISENRGLGKNNQLLFKIPEDFKRMKVLTTGHPIIMGRKTYESIGRPLPNRINIIITRDTSFNPHKFCSSEKCEALIIVCNSLEEAIKVGKEAEKKKLSLRGTTSRSNLSGDRHASLAMTNDGGEIFIFGGGEIFKQSLPFVDRLYLTVVKQTVDADTFFPDYSEFTKIIHKEERRTKDGLEYTFLDLTR